MQKGTLRTTLISPILLQRLKHEKYSLIWQRFRVKSGEKASSSVAEHDEHFIEPDAEKRLM
jgi:hypothetical protein